MKRLIMLAVVLALFGTGVALTLDVPEPSRVSPKGLDVPGIRAGLSSKLLNGPYACCDPPPLGIEGPECR